MLKRIDARDWFRALLDLFLPRKCLVCGGSLALHEDHVCISCLADMPFTRFSAMRRNEMADRLNEMISQDFDDRSSVRGYSQAASLFFYRNSTGYDKITQSLKYHSNLASGRYFSSMLSDEMAISGLYDDVDAVVPVPLHWTRKFLRGYNQASVIGKELSRGLGANLREDILIRSRSTRTQTKLSVEEKRRNVANAFKVRPGADLQGLRHILIVDDVFTTGSTLHACYLALHKVLPSTAKISIATLACVER